QGNAICRDCLRPASWPMDEGMPRTTVMQSTSQHAEGPRSGGLSHPPCFPTEHRIEIREQFLAEAMRVEADGLAPRRRRREVARSFLELLQRRREAVRTLLLEPQPRRLAAPARRDDRLGSPALAEGDDRGATGHRLDRHDAEVFLAGKQQGPAAAEMIA